MWVVDTCVIIDICDDDSQFGRASALLLEKFSPQGLAICPVTAVELAPAFDGNIIAQKESLIQIGIDYTETWTTAETELAHDAWHAFVTARKTNKAPRRPIADILIGAFAMNRGGLITRNPADFRRWFPKLSIKEP